MGEKKGEERKGREKKKRIKKCIPPKKKKWKENNIVKIYFSAKEEEIFGKEKKGKFLKPLLMGEQELREGKKTEEQKKGRPKCLFKNKWNNSEKEDKGGKKRWCICGCDHQQNVWWKMRTTIQWGGKTGNYWDYCFKCNYKQIKKRMMPSLVK